MEDIDRDQSEHLKNLRLAAGLDHAQLAALSNLSAGQLRQLEEGGDNLFYSPQIKSQSLRRVIRLLENPAPSGNPSKVYVEESAPRSGGNVIEDIIRLSETNHKGSFLSTSARQPDRSGLIFSFIVLLALVLAVFSWWKSTQQTPVKVFTEWIDPLPINQVPSASSTESVTPLSATNTSTQEVAVVQSPVAPLTANAEIKSATPPVVAGVKPTEPNPANTAKSVQASTETAAIAKSTPIASLNGADLSANEKSQVSKSDNNDCTSINSEALSAKSYSATKPGNYIYVVATKPVQLCVDDGLKKRTVVNLEPGIGRSIHGAAPWTVSSNSLSTVQIYFQGSKVNLPSETANRIYLKEQSQTP